MEVDKSSLIVSKAGRDKGQLFYVIDTDEQYVYLADGKSRKLEKPKRKKRKHVEQVPRTESRIAEKIRNGEKVLNSELRKELASFGQKQSQNQGG
jgi:large subunit ribosomal protein L14e